MVVKMPTYHLRVPVLKFRLLAQIPTKAAMMAQAVVFLPPTWEI